MGAETLSRENNHNESADQPRGVGAIPSARAGSIEQIAPFGEDQALEILARARTVVDPALRAAVESMPESMRRVVAYHFGWREVDGTPAEADAGKAIRPALVLAAAQACAANSRAADSFSLNSPAVRSAVRAAAAVELVHNFTLLHDDVIDRDVTRRHRPTAWRAFGATEAILAGDALHSLALRTLAEDTHAATGPALRRLAHCVVELCDGQQADCAFEQRSTVSLDECLAMAEAKTGALLGTACAIGALYGERTRPGQRRWTPSAGRSAWPSS